QPHPEEVDVNGLAANAIALGLLEYDRRRFLAVDAQVENRSRGRERQTQLARVDLEPRGLPAASVDDARHPARAAQPAGRARAVRDAATDLELCSGVSHGRLKTLAIRFVADGGTQRPQAHADALQDASAATHIDALDDRQPPDHRPRQPCLS